MWKEIYGWQERENGIGKNREIQTGNRQRDKDRLSATHHCGLSHWQQSLPPPQPSIMVMEAPSEH